MWINTELSGCVKGHDYSQEMTLGDFVRSIKSKDVVVFPSLFIPFPFPVSLFWPFVDSKVALGLSWLEMRDATSDSTLSTCPGELMYINARKASESNEHYSISSLHQHSSNCIHSDD